MTISLTRGVEQLCEVLLFLLDFFDGRIQLGPIDVPLAEASEAWESALPNLLDG